MHILRRLSGLSLLLAVAVAAIGLQAGTRTAAAQTVSATLSCNSATCTISLNSYIAPGGSFTVTLPNGGQAITSCPSGCTPGSQFVVNLNGTAVITAPVATVATQAYAQPVAYAPPGGLCVNGSYPGPFGCTSPLGYSGYGGYGSYRYGGYSGYGFPFYNNQWFNNSCFGIWNNCGGGCFFSNCNGCLSITFSTWRHC